MSPTRKSPGRTWAIGDIHGCYRTLERLLDKIPFKEKRDRLWLVGDLVNRGTGSAQVLRWAKRRQKELGPRFRMVLGNHDLHLIAVHRGISKLRRGDTLTDVFESPDAKKLVRWLGRQPLLHREPEWILVHAGLLPQWTSKTALHTARELETELREGDDVSLLQRRPHSRLPKGFSTLRHDLGVLTRLRMCQPNGSLARYSGPPEAAPAKLVPWYALPKTRWSKRTVVCGHWAAQGLRLEERMIALDSGCAWGGRLSAVRLEDRKIVQVRCRKADRPV